MSEKKEIYIHKKEEKLDTQLGVLNSKTLTVQGETLKEVKKIFDEEWCKNDIF